MKKTWRQKLEGHKIIARGKTYQVADWERYLFRL